MQRLVVISDLHCGHVMGLTPPDFDSRPNERESRAYEFWTLRQQAWKWFETEIDLLKATGSTDVLLVNGDAIEGKGERSGSTELLTADRTEQVDMAAAVIKTVGARQVFMSYGTGSHTGKRDDWENTVAKSVEAEKIKDRGTLAVEGTIFDYRHHIGNSSVPYGRATPALKQKLYNVLWADRKERKRADVVLRSHVHALVFVGDSDALAVITPALQIYCTKFGSRRMDNTVDFGFIHFDVYGPKDYSWEWHIKRFPIISRFEHDVVQSTNLTSTSV